jgi:MFS family permease
MGIGCFITVIATLIQAFAPKHQVGVFILGRVIIGIGQGMALSELCPQIILNHLVNRLQLPDHVISEK